MSSSRRDIGLAVLNDRKKSSAKVANRVRSMIEMLCSIIWVAVSCFVTLMVVFMYQYDYFVAKNNTMTSDEFSERRFRKVVPGMGRTDVESLVGVPLDEAYAFSSSMHRYSCGQFRKYDLDFLERVLYGWTGEKAFMWDSEAVIGTIQGKQGVLVYGWEGDMSLLENEFRVSQFESEEEDLTIMLYTKPINEYDSSFTRQVWVNDSGLVVAKVIHTYYD